jgi:hypothetical protein
VIDFDGGARLARGSFTIRAGRTATVRCRFVRPALDRLRRRAHRRGLVHAMSRTASGGKESGQVLSLHVVR